MSNKKTIKACYSFLYHQGGTESEIIEATLIEKIAGAPLRIAFDKALMRYSHPLLCLHVEGLVCKCAPLASFATSKGVIQSSPMMSQHCGKARECILHFEEKWERHYD